MKDSPQRVIGLTGNIACGKSAVASFLRSNGYAVVDADQISRDVVCPGSQALQEIARAFGESVLNHDGTLNRKNLRELVFRNPTYRTTLETITHPAIVQESNQEFQRLFSAGKTLVFYEASLLVENNRHKDLDGLIVVTCPPDQQLDRLMKRDGVTKELALKMIQSQMPLALKAAQADWVIENNGDLQALELDVQKVLSKLSC